MMKTLMPMPAIDDPLLPFRRVSLAPMMDVTDRHFRYLCRLISPTVLLYSEMVTTGAVLHGPRAQLLNFSTREKPVALQLGGSDPKALAECAKIGQDYGYDEINLNVGCPSDRVQSGGFGACMMAKPKLVADCLSAMRNAVKIPVTIKTRIGIDEQDSYEHFAQFIEITKQSGVNVFIVHARKALLSGLNAKKNRQIPELVYDYVYRIAREHADRLFVINGGVASVGSILDHLGHVQGVMIGREAQRNPYLFAKIECALNHSHVLTKRASVFEEYLHYVMQQVTDGQRLRKLIRPLHGMFLGLPHARSCRQILNELMTDTQASAAVVQTQLAQLCESIMAQQMT